MNELLFVLLILVAIGLHEYGHYATAKKFNIKVDKFFIGFGPKIWSFRRGETEYGFNWIPAGGYVRIAGMNPFEEIAPEDRDRVFKAKPPWQRAIVLAAGSTMHFILAFVILAAMLMFDGVPETTTTVEKVSAGSPAAAGGFADGDTVLAIEGEPVESWEEVRDFIRDHPGAKADFRVRTASGAEAVRTVTLGSENPDTKEKVGFLGVQTLLARDRLGPISAVTESGKSLGRGMVDSLRGLKQIVAPSTLAHLFRRIAGEEDRSPGDPTSIVGITRDAAAGGFATLMYYFIGFNIFVGVANLLPLPPLDGGHLAVLAYEKVRRRDVDMRRLIPVTAAVLMLLVGLFLMTLYLDIVQPPVPQG